jgi:hypothetical protein
MINLKASRKTGTINVGVNPITNINVSTPNQAPTGISNPLPSLNYPDPNFPSVAPGIYDPSANGNVGPVATEVQYKTPEELDAEAAARQDLAEKEALLREINVLKLIINIQHSNPMIVNKYIVADDDALGKMVGLLCNASEVHLDAEDVGVGCVSKKTYRKVNSIYVVVNGETLNLKYNFPAVMKTLKDLHISTKFVW